MVRDFQSIVGIEAREQIQELIGKLPEMYGIEPAGSGLGFGQHAATLTLGKPGMIHGFKCHVLTDAAGNPAPVHTIASGLDYP